MKGCFSVVLIVLMIVWGMALLGGLASGMRSLKSELNQLELAIPDQTGKKQVLSIAATIQSAIPFNGFLARLGNDSKDRINGVIAITALHAAIGVQVLPLGMLLLAAGWASGLAKREDIRSGARFASPLRAWIGKRMGFLGIGFVVVFALSPALLPWWILWVGLMVMAIGTRIYVANLPLKL